MTMNILAPIFPAVVDAAVKATILLGLAWIAASLLKNHPAALRHMIRACALCGALLLPVLSSLGPAWHWRVLPQLPLTEQQAATSVETVVPPLSHESATSSAEPASQPLRTSATMHPSHFKSDLSPIAGSRVAPVWPQLLMVVWLLGAVIGKLRLLVSRLRFAVLINKTAPVDDPSWTLQIKKISHLLGIRRSVALLESKDTEVPLAAGAFRPKVILSPDYPEWPPLRRDAILHHELAHIRRWDILAQMLCQIAIAMYWFHPLVWITVRAMRAEREQACDDHVLAAGARPSEYAHELLEIASSLRQPEFTVALAMARRSQLEGRVMALLNPMQRRGSISRKTTLAIAFLTLCAVLPLAAIQTAAPRDQSTEQRKPATPAPSQNVPAAEANENVPPEPQTPEAMPAPPEAGAIAPPAPATPPVEGVPGAVQGGVHGGVEGGIQGGVRNRVPKVPPMPSAPRSSPVLPDAASPAIAPLPPARPPAGVQNVPAIPKSPRAPASPRAVPRPEVAPVAPRALPEPPEGGIMSPAPRPVPAPRVAAAAEKIKALRAQPTTSAAPAGASSQNIEALRANIAAFASTASSGAPETSRLRAQGAAIAAQAAPIPHDLATMRAQLAAAAATAPQATACISAEAAALRAQIAAISNRQGCQKHD